MGRKAGFTIALAMLIGAAPVLAQDWSEDARDKLLPKGSGDWEEQPWWVALADCAAAFRATPEDKQKVQVFGAAALARVSKDRGIPAREAAAVVMPYLNGPLARERVEVIVGIFGDTKLRRSDCENVLTAARAL